MATVTATATILGWQGNVIRRRVASLLELYRPVLREQLKQEIRKPQYSWPRATKRRNGTIVTSPRNIVDTGAFVNSQTDFFLDPRKLLFTWGGFGGPVTYAGIILRGKSNYPSRDWITKAIAERPLAQFAIKNWGRTRAPLPAVPTRP